MSVILSLLKELKHVKRLFLAGLLLLLLATAGSQLAPLILQELIDHNLTEVSKGLVLHQTDFLTKFSCLYRPFALSWSFALRFFSGADSLCQSSGHQSA